MKIQHEIEGLLSDISIIQSETRRLTDRVHSLEFKIGNKNVAAILDFNIRRVTVIEKWQSEIENWMRRVESKLDQLEART